MHRRRASCTAYYFVHFLIILPLLGLIETPRPLPGSIAEAVLGQGRLGIRDAAGAAVAEHQGLSGYGDQDDAMITTCTRLAAGLLAAGVGRRGARPGGRAPEPPQRRAGRFAGPFGTFDQAAAAARLQGLQARSARPATRMSLRGVPQPRRAGRARLLRGAGQGARGRVQGQGRPERQRRHVRAARPARPTASRRPSRTSRPRAAANGGALPPDLSLIAKARTYERGFPWFVFDIVTQYQEQGVDYIHALLTGYEEPPHGVEVPDGKYYNPYFPGHVIAMPPAAQRRPGDLSEDRRQPRRPRRSTSMRKRRRGLPDVGGRAAPGGAQAARASGC